MNNVFLVGVGGFVGSVLRYLVSNYLHQSNKDFPFGTLVVNVVGCFAIGFLSHLTEAHGMFEEHTQSFIFIGVLGGFTTFSSFGNETIKLARDSQVMNAFANVSANVILGLIAVWLGRALAAMVWR